jgi:hypothetical protein
VILRGWTSPASRELRNKLQKSALMSAYGHTESPIFIQKELKSHEPTSRKVSLKKYITKYMGKQKKFYLFDHGEFLQKTRLGSNWTLPPVFNTLPGYNHFNHDVDAWKAEYFEFYDGKDYPLQRQLDTASPTSVAFSPRLIFALAADASGIGLHYHKDTYNVLVFGTKRWVLYDHIGS